MMHAFKSVVFIFVLMTGSVVNSVLAQVLSFEDAKHRADAGDAFAQAVVATHYQLGWMTEKNVELAAKYAVASANQRNPLGLFRLGSLLRAGEGVKKNEEQGLEFQAISLDGLKRAEDPYSITALGILIFQGRVVAQNVPQQERYREAARLYRLAADMGYAPAQFNFAMALNDGSGVEKNPELFEKYLKKAQAASYPLAESFGVREIEDTGKTNLLAMSLPLAEASKINTLITQDKRDSANSIEGFADGERWAYEFIEHKITPTTSLATDSSGLLAFADSEIVVRSAEFRGTVQSGSIKTELSFYDAKSGALRATVAIPNRVFQVGRINNKNDGFFIGTVTAAKYRYDDCPLNLTLIDLEKRRLERIPLVQEDYWLALQNAVDIRSVANRLVVRVQPGLSRQYVSDQTESSLFKDLKLTIEETSRVLEKPYHHDINETRHADIIQEDSAALSYLGDAPIQSKDPASNRGSFAVGGTGNGQLPQVFRVYQGKQLQILDLSNLRHQSRSAAHKGAYFPHIFADGSFGYIAGPNLHNFREQESLKIPLPRTGEQALEALSNAAEHYRPQVYEARPDETFSTETGPSIRVAYSDYLAGFGISDKFFKAEIPLNPEFKQISFSAEALERLKESIRRGSIKGISKDTAEDMLRKSAHELIQDWEPISNTFVVSDGGFFEWFRVDAETGEPMNPLLSGGGHGYYSGITYSNTSDGWRAFSFINDSHTGGYAGCILLEKVGGEREPIIVADDLPDKASPLSLKALTETVLILYGKEGLINLVSVNILSGESEVLKAWQFPSRFGEALCDHKSGTVFIPSASGFEVWSIWDETPSKFFDLILGEGDQYAILLPNGLYAGSPGCETILRLKVGNDLLDGSSVSHWRNRPAEVLKVLGGEEEQIEVLSRVTERWLGKLGNPEEKPQPTAKDIPSLVLTNEVPLWAETGQVVLEFKTEPGASAVEQVVVRVNGVDQNFGANSISGQASIERPVTLAEGQNWIEAVAIDEQGHTSNLVRLRTILGKPKAPRKRYVIAVGISNYQDRTLNLEFAAKDAADFARVLGEISDIETEILLLTNEQADKSIVDKIREFLDKAVENDEVVAFFAGHGVLDSNLDYIFASHEFDAVNPSATGIHLDNLVDAVGSSRSLKRLILLDTCHSGQVGERDEILLAEMGSRLPVGVRSVQQRGMSVKPIKELTEEGRQRFIEEMFLLPGIHRGINIIGASGGAEFALESDQWNNGVFTASLLDGLQNKAADLNGDSRVTVSELRDFLAQRVTELTNGAQKPSVVAFERDQDFALIE